MSLELRLLEFCEFATQGPDNKLVIINTFDRVGVKLKDGVSLPFPPDAKLALPSVFAVCILYASISDGTRHSAQLRVLHEDGEQATDPIDLGEIVFPVNPQGRPMRFQAIISLLNFPVPGPADYRFELWVDGAAIGFVNLYVELIA